MYFWCFGFRSELGFLNCDDVCMCVVNKQFELLEFVSESVYVDLQYDEISLTFTAGPVCLCGVSSPVVVLGPSSGSAWPACPKNGKSGPHCWGRGGSTQFAQQLESAVTAPPLVGCVVWSQDNYMVSLTGCDRLGRC